MVTATAGVLISCDIPVKQFLLHVDEKEMGKFIISDLDETHVLVKESALDYIKSQLDKLYEENQYTFIQ